MNKLLKYTVTGLASMMTIVFAAGCSNVATYEVQLPTAAAALTIDELEAAYSETNPLEIDFWTGFGSSVTSLGIDPAIEQFQEAYPWIKVTHTSKGGYDNLLKAINLSITSNSYPNIAVGYPDHFASYIRSGIQYALDPFLESTDPDISVDVDDYIADYMTENRSFQFKDEEKTDPYTLGIPFNKSTEVMVVNKTFMDWISTKDTSIIIPTTWDEVRTVGEKILATMARVGAYGSKIDEYNNVNPNAGKTGYPKLLLDFSGVSMEDFRPFSYDSTSNLFITLVRQWGGTYTKMGENITKGYVQYDNPATIEMLDFFKELHDDQIFAIPPSFGEASYNSVPFVGLKSVMTISSSAGVYNNVPTGGAFDVEIHPVIAKDENHKYVISQGTNLAIFKKRDAQKVLASWLFVKFVTTVANAEFAINTGYYPVTTSGLESPLYQAYIGTTDDSASNLSKIGAAKVNALTYGVEANNWTKFVDPGFVGSSDIREQIGTIFPMLFYGKDGIAMTSQEIIDYSYSQLSRYIEPVVEEE
ncbi:MAG TPA: hypothetical protein DCM23_01395 [Firmicutes bacterium]|nr:hypothetical protein [Bacillota bacterium]